MQLISKAEAKAQGLARYYTGKPCLRGHLSVRFTYSGHCSACRADIEQRPEVKERKALTSAAWAKENPERTREIKKEWCKANPEKLSKAAKIWRTANPERHAENGAAWKKTNSHLVAAGIAQRRAAKLKATPAWADRQAIKKIYDDCAFTSRVTGEKHHVDHIYPLQSDWVCGLHVPLNLQILTATENLTKSNKLLEQFA